MKKWVCYQYLFFTEKKVKKIEEHFDALLEAADQCAQPFDYDWDISPFVWVYRGSVKPCWIADSEQEADEFLEVNKNYSKRIEPRWYETSICTAQLEEADNNGNCIQVLEEKIAKDL